MIVDFGIAKHAVDSPPRSPASSAHPLHVTGAGARRGRGNQTDLFSMGIMIYEMLAGVPCFFGDSLPSLTHQIINVERHRCAAARRRA